ncbi:hypothetical protein DFH09DRAFT_1299571 [Mycena vulgaris]|nr:hypothetical protein DFH09DRAFT_1299571 [Mycena vulgaris]
MLKHRHIEFWLEDSGGRRIPHTSAPYISEGNVFVDAEIEENSCYVARWRTVQKAMNVQCELFVSSEEEELRASVYFMEATKKKTQSQSSKNKLVHPFARSSMLRAPLDNEDVPPIPGPVDVEKSDNRSDEFHDPKEEFPPYMTLEIRLNTFPKAKPASRSKRVRESSGFGEDESDSGPSGSHKRPRNQVIVVESDSSESDTNALLREIKAAED